MLLSQFKTTKSPLVVRVSGSAVSSAPWTETAGAHCPAPVGFLLLLSQTL